MASIQDILNIPFFQSFLSNLPFVALLESSSENTGQMVPFSSSKFFLALINYRLVQTPSLLNRGFEAPHKLALFGFIIIFQHNRTHHAISHLLAFSQAVLPIWNAHPTASVYENPIQPLGYRLPAPPRKSLPLPSWNLQLFTNSTAIYVCFPWYYDAFV